MRSPNVERVRLNKEWDRGDVVLGPGLIFEVDEIIAANLVAAGFAEYADIRKQYAIKQPHRVAAFVDKPPRLRRYGTR